MSPIPVAPQNGDLPPQTFFKTVFGALCLTRVDVQIDPCETDTGGVVITEGSTGRTVGDVISSRTVHSTISCHIPVKIKQMGPERIFDQRFFNTQK